MKVNKLKVYDLEESIIASGYPMMVELLEDNCQQENFKYWLDNNLVEIYNIVKTNNLKVVNDYVVLSIDDKEIFVPGEELITVNEHFGKRYAYNGYLLERYSSVNVVEPEDIMQTLERAIRALKRFYSLGRTGGNEGHNQFLTGIRVAFDLTFSNKAWVEAERYRFLEFVSSQSTMHRITRLDIRKCCNKYVWESTIENLEKAVAKYNAIENKGSEEAKELYLEILYNVPSGFELTARLTTNYRALKTIYGQRKNHRLPEWREFCEYIREELPLFKELVLGE